MNMFYLASPMTDPEKREKETVKDFFLFRNEKIAKKLEQNGIKIYLPQRDTNQSYTPKKIFLKNLDAIKKSKGLIVVLSDTRGIYLEAGYAKALGKKVIGLKVSETKPLGTMVRNFLDTIVNSVDDLVLLLNKMEKEKNEDRRNK